MKDKNKTFVTILIILGIIVFSVVILNKPNPKISGEIVKDITSKSTLYISNGCPHCINQLEILGECANLNIVDCTKEPNKCLEAEIMRVPTWVIDGKKFYRRET